MNLRNRIGEDLDAVLHLLDRQVFDRDGAMVGKVDDVELTEDTDGSLAATGLLIGTAAWVGRLGGDHGRTALRWWHRLSPARADRTVPGWIDLADVDVLDSAVRLRIDRDERVGLQPGPRPGEVHHRLNDLIGMQVEGPAGSRLRERVVDVEVTAHPGDGHDRRWPVRTLLIGRARPGMLLGYERSDTRGPRWLAAFVSWLLRHSARVAWDDVAEVDWEQHLLRLRDEPTPLRAAG